MAHRRNSESEPSSKSSNSAAAEAAAGNNTAASATAGTDGSASPRLEFYFLTLFPEVFPPILSASLLGKACKKGLLAFHTVQIRDFATDRHRTVDDAPFGGGAGMVLRADVLYAAWESLQKGPERIPTILMSPQGRLFDQPKAKQLAGYSKLIIVCGHYEGLDERFIDLCVDEEISIGDYVLTGGELPAMVIADAVTRLIPGVVGKEESVERDSLEGDLLKYPQFTRPREFKGREVPEVLLSGDHGAIEKWRHAQMLERTGRKRPDLANRKKGN